MDKDSLDKRYSITEEEKKVLLSRYYREDGSPILRTIPAKQKKKVILLQHMSGQFSIGKDYTEKQVNEIIMRFFDDFATVRRMLIDFGFMERSKDCSVYWPKE
jgi:hypothetical protein